MTNSDRAISFLELVRGGDTRKLIDRFGNEPGFPNITDDCGTPLLIEAIYHGSLDLIRDLIAAGASVNDPAADGFPSLFAAIDRRSGDRYELLEILVDAGADPNQRGVNDYTALHYAACRDDAEAVKCLLRGGADPELRTRIDHYATALEEARRFGWHRAAVALAAAT